LSQIVQSSELSLVKIKKKKKKRNQYQLVLGAVSLVFNPLDTMCVELEQANEACSVLQVSSVVF
jgi:hypothetical protein